MASLIACGVCAAITGLAKILGGFRDTITVEKVGVIMPEDGNFKSLVSVSSSNSQTLSSKKLSRAAMNYMKMLDDLIPAVNSQKREEFRAILNDTIEFGALESGNSNFVASYNQNSGVLSFFSFHFAYVDENHFRSSNTLLTAKFSLPSSFEIFSTTKENLFRTEVTHSIQEIPPSVKPEDVVNALAMLLAPVTGGFVEVNDDLKESLNSINASNPDYANGKSMFT